MRRKIAPRDTLSLAGWIFADLMLGLAMMFFAISSVGTYTPAKAEEALPTSTTTPRPTNTARPTSTATPRPTNTARPTSTATPRPTSTATPRPTQGGPSQTATASALVAAAATATPTPGVCQATVVLVKNEINIERAPGAREPSVEQIRAAFEPFRDRRAGLVLTFGHAGDPNSGETLAKRVNEVLRREFPQIFVRDTLMESFHRLKASSAGSVDFDIYFISNTCS